MLAHLLEFVMNHYVLVGTFIALVILFLRNESRLAGATVTPAELVRLVNHEQAVVIDVRDGKEYNSGHIVDSINVPHSAVEANMDRLEKYKSTPVVVVCNLGQHAGTVGKKLRSQGFKDVRRLSGGISEWRAGNLPLVK